MPRRGLLNQLEVEFVVNLRGLDDDRLCGAEDEGLTLRTVRHWFEGRERPTNTGDRINYVRRESEHEILDGLELWLAKCAITTTPASTPGGKSVDSDV